MIILIFHHSNQTLFATDTKNKNSHPLLACVQKSSLNQSKAILYTSLLSAFTHRGGNTLRWMNLTQWDETRGGGGGGTLAPGTTHAFARAQQKPQTHKRSTKSSLVILSAALMPLDPAHWRLSPWNLNNFATSVHLLSATASAFMLCSWMYYVVVGSNLALCFYPLTNYILA